MQKIFPPCLYKPEQLTGGGGFKAFDLHQEKCLVFPCPEMQTALFDFGVTYDSFGNIIASAAVFDNGFPDQREVFST